MADLTKMFLILVCLSVSVFANEYLGTPNAMWPIIKSTVSEEHKAKIGQQ